MPFELMKKVMMTGIGLALKTQSEMEALTKDMIKKTKMGEAEGKKFVDDVMKKYEKAKKDMEQKIRKGIADYMSEADIASKKELNALKQEIKNLKKASKTKK
jgi:polyhydroxyalkanoate synthesis regulator phasin